ncbi:MAG: hypothetical protein ACSHX6_13650 [Akkermansiaceae bacterium]
MNKFDKICAVLSIPIGAVFMLLGVVGLFTGSRANFDLPPVIGFLPFFLGWAMCVTVIKFWKKDGAELPPNITSAKFHEFLSRHPEFRSAPMKMQWGAFHKWLDQN